MWNLFEKQEVKNGLKEGEGLDRYKDFTSVNEIDLSFACLLNSIEEIVKVRQPGERKLHSR
jgi:hypothetical protein